MTDYSSDRKQGYANIDHIIVLMMENRSFDNLLGWLYENEPPPRGQSFEGLSPDLFNPLDRAGSAEPEIVHVGKVDCSQSPGFCTPAPNPAEGFKATNQQLFGTQEPQSTDKPDNMGFANSYAEAIAKQSGSQSDPRQIMLAFAPEDVPVLSTLAREYAVSDHWFGSIPSMTFPNRSFVHAGTSGGAVDNFPNPICAAETIFNRMQDRLESNPAAATWKVYASTPQLEAEKHGAKHNPGDSGHCASLTRLAMSQLQAPALDPMFRPLDEFYTDATNGTLPGYAFLEPHFFEGAGETDQHPPADIRPGEALIRQVYEALVASPCWEKSLLIITYDEHGGCYDHVPPPAATPPDPAAGPGQYGFEFDRLGPRVPTVVISPYIQRGTIFGADSAAPFDHTSILATLRNCFDLGAPLTARDAAAPDLGFLLSLNEPRSDRPTIPAARTETRPGATGRGHAPGHIARLASEVLSGLTGTPVPRGKLSTDSIKSAYADYLSRKQQPSETDRQPT